jgi:hypothetical protein
MIKRHQENTNRTEFKDGSTLIYIDLENKLFNNTSEGFTSRVAHNVGEACSLIEAGFEYAIGEYNDGGKIFRRRN